MIGRIEPPVADARFAYFVSTFEKPSADPHSFRLYIHHVPAY